LKFRLRLPLTLAPGSHEGRVVSSWNNVLSKRLRGQRVPEESVSLRLQSNRRLRAMRMQLSGVVEPSPARTVQLVVNKSFRRTIVSNKLTPTQSNARLRSGDGSVRPAVALDLDAERGRYLWVCRPEAAGGRMRHRAALDCRAADHHRWTDRAGREGICSQKRQSESITCSVTLGISHSPLSKQREAYKNVADCLQQAKQ
jgi:hypothetical protein